MKTSKKILAVLLTIATIIGIFSCATTVFAEDYNQYADEKAKNIIHKKAKCDSVAEFQEIPKAKRDKLLRVLKEQGLSIRQISRLTGTPKGVVERAVKDSF